jgi:hypothetical protein
MNMEFDKSGRRAHRLEFSDTNACLIQGIYWDAYVTALNRAQETRNKDDARLAYAAWVEFNLAYLTAEEQPSEYPVPRLLRGLM